MPGTGRHHCQRMNGDLRVSDSGRHAFGFHMTGSTAQRGDRDLYCLHCGYNLRGHGDDPIRCPECGDVNSVADLEVPAELIHAQLRRLETGPGLCVTAVAALGGWLLPLSWVMVARPLTPPPMQAWVVLFLLMALAVTAWVAGLLMFCSSCRRKPGWFGALLGFHFYGLMIAALGLAAIWFVLGLPLPRLLVLPFLPLPLGRILVPISLFLALILAAPRMYRRAKKLIRPLQRSVAVSIIRENARDA